ncbi:MAG TPA: apolipoprotein N-acyltransferase [Bryobacteraceae bacterium]|nr:apolipoprotein N-acyltransferase [Bryobacteraceae bacterium]
MNFALALLSAVLLVSLYPNIVSPGAGLPWFAPVALVPLLIALAREPRPVWRFLLGEFAGVIYWFAICYWIQFVLEVHGSMGYWGSRGTFALFCVLKALHLALFSLLAAVLMGTRWGIPAVAALWTGIERTHGTFGFAWLDLGNAGIDMALPLRVAPVIGVYGLSFLFALMSAVIAFLILRRGRRHVYWLAVIPALLLLPDLPGHEEPHETALVVQPNINPEQEWTYASFAAEREKLIRESLVSPEQLVIWPESPAPLYFYRDPEFHRQAMEVAQMDHAYFLFGTVAATHEGAPLNSAVLLRPDGSVVDRYDKINLVPFGEFVPKIFGFVNRVTQEAGDFAPGNRIVVFPMGAQKLGTFICYESVFPDEVRQFARGGANLLVNISNDGYFGKSAAREQHLEIARMRAVENDRWLIRATNDGITATVDPAGHIDERLPLSQEIAAPMHFAYRSGITFYTRHGDWFAWGCLIAAIAALLWSQRPNYSPERVSSEPRVSKWH